MKPVRVLVVDDSVVVRRLVSDILSENPSIEVVGAAATGCIALTKIEQLKPTLVVLDVEMPEMDGLAVLQAIRSRDPSMPVIMYSTLTERGASETMQALALGASDYVTKPCNSLDMTQAIEQVRSQLIPMILALSGFQDSFHESPETATADPAESGQPIRIVVMASSTGGPNALAEILPALPPDFDVPVVVVQHMPPIFTRSLAQRLDGLCSLTVREAESGAIAEPGTVWIAAGGHHLELEWRQGDTHLAVTDGPPVHSCRPAADILFESAVEVHGGHCLGIVLTGMGKDGLAGARGIREVGGRVFVQDKASSVVWTMPGVVAQNGLADRIVPCAGMANAMINEIRESKLPSRRPAPLLMQG